MQLTKCSSIEAALQGNTIEAEQLSCVGWTVTKIHGIMKAGMLKHLKHCMVSARLGAIAPHGIRKSEVQKALHFIKKIGLQKDIIVIKIGCRSKAIYEEECSAEALHLAFDPLH